MYHIHTNASEYSEKIFNHILSTPFSADAKPDDAKSAQMRNIADLSFDLLTQAQKMEKLQKLNQLSATEKSEYVSIVRLIGTMIYLLKQYNYKDQEMMDGLVKRYEKYSHVVQRSEAWF